MTRRAHAAAPLMAVGDTDPFRPSAERPVRVRARNLPADTHFEPHRHQWAQLAYCASGVLQVTAALAADARDEISYIVPFVARRVDRARRRCMPCTRWKTRHSVPCTSTQQPSPPAGRPAG